MKPVLVDLDGTLLDQPSSEARFIRHLVRGRVVGPRQGLAAVAYLLRWWPRYGRAVVRKNKAYLAGLECERVATLARRFVTCDILPVLRPYMLERLRLHVEAGERIVLITGAPEFIAVPVARHLNAEACSATICDHADGLYTANPPHCHPCGAAKLTLAERWCNGQGVDLRDCTAYADARYDEPLLAAVGRPVAVTPDRGLAETARRRGWEIIGSPAVRYRARESGASLPD